MNRRRLRTTPSLAGTKQRPVALRFIGVGEGLDDLRPFEAQAFVDALFDEEQ